MTKISSFRASIIWVETIPSTLEGTLPAGAPFAFLGQAAGYAKAFDDCQAGNVRADGLALPWSKPGNYFWKRYFEGKEARDQTGAQAWKKLVPFRRSLGCTTITENPAATVSFEAFYAPQGLAVVAKIEYRGEPLPVLDVAKIALAARYDYRFAIAGNAGPPAGLSLDHAADVALDVARREAFGDVNYNAANNTPFSVASFIIGEVDDVAAPVKDGSDEHRALEAVTSWNQLIDKVDLATVPIAKAKLPMHEFLASDLMYAHRTARAIWLPRCFAQQASRPKISCYHRNIMVASLQALMLGEFVSWVAARRTSGNLSSPILLERAKRAADVLQLMMDGKTATYRTASVAEQAKRANWAADIAVVKAP